MGLYSSDKEEVQQMINESISNAQIKANKIISEEVQVYLILTVGIVTSVLMVFSMFMNTIKYTSNQKTIRKNIEIFGEYNSQVANEVIVDE